MKWSREINKSFGGFRNKFYRGRKELRTDGYCRGNAIVIHELAIKGHDEGFTCPHCGGKYLECETEQYVAHESFPPLTPYIETHNVCEVCGNAWTIRTRANGETVITYFTDR